MYLNLLYADKFSRVNSERVRSIQSDSYNLLYLFFQLIFMFY